MLKTKKQFQAPRQILKWIDSLDLSYQIKNFTRDISNGYIVAEILSQVDKTINMNRFYNQFSQEKKLHNWNEIQKILKSINFQLTEEQIRKVIYMEEDFALELIIKLYNFLQKKKLKYKIKNINNIPYFAQPTANFLSKNIEFNSIPNINLKKEKIKTQSKNHLQKMKMLKQNLNLENYIKKRKQQIVENYLKQLKPKKKYQSQIKDEDIYDDKIDATKVIALKKYQKEEPKQREGVDSNYKKNNFILQVGELIQKRFKLTGIQHQFFVADDFQALIEDPKSFDFEIVESIFQIIRYITKDIFDLIGGSIKNFNYFFISFLELINNLPPQDVYFQIIDKTFIEFSHHVNKISEIIQIYMENTGLFALKNFCLKNDNKVIFAASIINSLFKKDLQSRTQMICRIQEIFGKNLDSFYHLLARLSCYEIQNTENIDYTNIVLYYARGSLKSNSVYNLTSGLKILQNVFDINPEIVTIEFYNLNPKNFIKIQYWEIDSLILIISSKAILHLQNFQNNEKVIQYFYSLIRDILLQDQPKATIQIAINYLSELQGNYCEFQELYLQILLQQSIDFLESQLCNSQKLQKFYFPKNQRNFSYQLYGAQLKWDSLNFCLSIQKYIHQNQIEILDQKLCFLMQKNLEQKIKYTQENLWINFFKEFSVILINTLKCENLCEKTSEIFFYLLNENIFQNVFLKEKFDQMYDTLYEIQKNADRLKVKENCFRLILNLSKKEPFFQFCYNLLNKFSQEDFQCFLYGNYDSILNQLTNQYKNKIGYKETIQKSIELLFKNNQIQNNKINQKLLKRLQPKSKILS